MIVVGDELVGIEKQTAANGLGMWDTAGAALSSTWSTAEGNVNAASAGSPWGNDAAGSAFAAQYKGVAELFTAGRTVIDGPNGIIALGKNARTAIENSLVSDEEQEKILKKPIKGS